MTTTTTVRGYVTREAELRFTRAGQPVVAFGVSSTRQYHVDGEWQEDTSYFNVVARGALALVAARLREGMGIIVVGRLDQLTYESSSGETRSVVDVVAEDIGLSLHHTTVDGERLVEEEAA